MDLEKNRNFRPIIWWKSCILYL